MLILLCFIVATGAQTCCCTFPGSSSCVSQIAVASCTQGDGTCGGSEPVPTPSPTTTGTSTCSCVVASAPGQCWCQFSPSGALPADPAACVAAGFTCVGENPATQDFLGDCYPDAPTALCLAAQGSCSETACIVADQATCCCLLPESQQCQPDTSAEWCSGSGGQCEGAPVALATVAPAKTCACVPPSASEKVQPREVPACQASGGRCRLPAADLTYDGRVTVDDLASLLVQYGNEV